MLIKQLPLSVPVTRKHDVRTQFSALCYRCAGDRTQVLLVTSRTTKRWITPKGWPVSNQTPLQSAEQEAWEEAGVVGKGHDQCLGIYSYLKEMDEGEDLPCVVMVYPVRVKSLARSYPERNERKRKWFTPKKAATRVLEPELARILRDFDPKLLG